MGRPDHHPMTPSEIAGMTLVLSLAAVAIAHWETAHGRSKDPLATEPRHRRHREEKRRRSRIRRANRTHRRPREYETIVQVAAVVHEAAQIADPAEPVSLDGGVARAIEPNVHRLRRVSRSGVLTDEERRHLRRFIRLLRRFTEGEAAFEGRPRDDLHDELRRAAIELQTRYSAEPIEAESART